MINNTFLSKNAVRVYKDPNTLIMIIFYFILPTSVPNAAGHDEEVSLYGGGGGVATFKNALAFLKIQTPNSRTCW